VGAARLVLVLAVYLVLAVALFWPAWHTPTSVTVGRGGDVFYSIWFLRWVAYALTHGLNPLVTNYLDFPAGVNLMWNGLFPLPAILLTPLTLTLGPVVAHTALVTLAVGGSSFTAFLAIRHYTRHDGGALLGGAVYGFSPYMMAQSLAHLHLTLAIIPPLLLLVMDEVFVRQRRSWLYGGSLLGLLGALQLWSGEELLATEVVVAAIGVGLLAGLYPSAVRVRAAHAICALCVAAAVALLLSSFPLAVQFFGPQRVSGNLQPLNTYVSDLFNFILPTRLQALAPPAIVQITDGFSGNLSEWNAYLGIPLIVVLAVGVYRTWADRMVRLWTLLATMLAMLSLGVTLHVGGSVTALPVGLLGLALGRVPGAPGRPTVFIFVGTWAALPVLPIVDNILPSRLMLYVFLFAGMLLAGLVASVQRAGRHRVRLLGALAVALLPLVPIVPLPSTDVSSPRFFLTDVADTLPNRATALVAPYSRGGWADAMLWQAASGMAFRMPEGYAFIPGPSSSPPPSAIGLRMVEIETLGGSTVDPRVRQEMLGTLAAWQVRAVIVGPMAHQADMIAFFTDLLGRPPLEREGVYVFADVAH
jgi:hypothetical protein